MPRKTPILLLTTLATLILLILLHRKNHTSTPPPPSLEKANATLGFGSILAVSRALSRRQASLLWAANLTDLEIAIPPQPAWTEADLRAFRLDEGSTISNGSALAWLGHLHALRQFLATSQETALVIEDDVDWDISVRTHQIPLLAASIRALLSPGSATANSKAGETYWAPLDQWDILYPGHCDDILPPNSPSDPLHPLHDPHILYRDATVPPHVLLHPDTSHFLHALRIPASTRVVHRTTAPFCTFAYAVTRASAARIVRDYGVEKEGVDAFDVQLLEACRGVLRCFSVAPELFHYADGRSVIASVDMNEAEERGDGEMRGMGVLGKGTWNVGCGARHGQLWVGESDEEGRARMKRVVKGMLEEGKVECPIDFVKAERGWRGCEWGECGAQS